jgi:hypothetical protein
MPRCSTVYARVQSSNATTSPGLLWRKQEEDGRITRVEQFASVCTCSGRDSVRRRLTPYLIGRWHVRSLARKRDQNVRHRLT